MTKTIKAIVQIRRNTEEYFESIKDTFIPLNGEIVLVDTQKSGLRSKTGNGTLTYAQLPFNDQGLLDQISGIVVKGYYYNGAFYTTISHTVTIVGYNYKLYIDIPTGSIYEYDTTQKQYNRLATVPAASSTEAGIMKLYNELGSNEDGTINQSTITTEFGKRFKVSTGSDETLNFYNNL